MAIYAELPNGTRLEFPNGTKQSVIDSVVKKQLSDNPNLFKTQIKTQNNDLINIQNNQHDLKKTYSEPKIITNNDPLSLKNSQIQKNNLSTQSKININNTVTAIKPQIAVSPIEKTSYPPQSQTDNSIYFWIIGTIVIIFLLSNNKKEHLKKHNEDNYYPKNYNSTSNSDTIMDFLIKTFTYCFMILIFLAGMFQYYATFVYYNSYLHWEVATSIFTAVLIHLIPFIGAFIGSFLSVIAATHVWGWDLWIAVLIFFPKTVMGALGLSIASISSLFNNKN
jgi:hypothetical protein